MYLSEILVVPWIRASIGELVAMFNPSELLSLAATRQLVAATVHPDGVASSATRRVPWGPTARTAPRSATARTTPPAIT